MLEIYSVSALCVVIKARRLELADYTTSDEFSIKVTHNETA